MAICFNSLCLLSRGRAAPVLPGPRVAPIARSRSVSSPPANGISDAQTNYRRASGGAPHTSTDTTAGTTVAGRSLNRPVLQPTPVGDSLLAQHDHRTDMDNARIDTRSPGYPKDGKVTSPPIRKRVTATPETQTPASMAKHHTTQYSMPEPPVPPPRSPVSSPSESRKSSLKKPNVPRPNRPAPTKLVPAPGNVCEEPISKPDVGLVVGGTEPSAPGGGGAAEHGPGVAEVRHFLAALGIESRVWQVLEKEEITDYSSKFILSAFYVLYYRDLGANLLFFVSRRSLLKVPRRLCWEGAPTPGAANALSLP